MSRLEQLVATPGARIVTAEMPLFDSGGFDAVQDHLDRLTPWVDAINATDNAAAHAHASNVAMAVAMARLGAEPIMQVVCRDKNRLALQSDIVGASMFGVENICCLTGDDVTAGDEPEARRVFDLDGPQLISLAHTIGSGSYLSGRKIEPPPDFFVGAVENPGAPPFEVRRRRAEKKADAGAGFLQLQLCYRPELLERFVAGVHERGVTSRCALLPSICMVGSAGALRFIDEKVPGVAIPAEVIAGVERSADADAACFELACEQARHALSLPAVAGIHLISFRKDAAIERLCQELGIPPRTEREQHGHRPPVAV
ncbi:MAG TPA: methylenetetrahydrofolate reductase [Solirubrobacteraceae bacterium]